MPLLPEKRYRDSVWLPRPIDEVFGFFEDPRNLEAITPPFLRFRVLKAPPRVRRGSLIAYALRLHGVPVLWLTRIAEHDPPHRFVDVQLVGPYLKWRHTHTFREERGGTRVEDIVDYAHIGGPLAERFVRRDVERIFEYRKARLRERFGRAPSP